MVILYIGVLPPGGGRASPQALAGEIRALPAPLQLLLLLIYYDGLCVEDAAALVQLSPAVLRRGLLTAEQYLWEQTGANPSSGEIRQAFVWAIAHEHYPEESIRRIRASLEQELF